MNQKKSWAVLVTDLGRFGMGLSGFWQLYQYSMGFPLLFFITQYISCATEKLVLGEHSPKYLTLYPAFDGYLDG